MDRRGHKGEGTRRGQQVKSRDRVNIQTRLRNLGEKKVKKAYANVKEGGLGKFGYGAVKGETARTGMESLVTTDRGGKN